MDSNSTLLIMRPSTQLHKNSTSSDNFSKGEIVIFSILGMAILFIFICVIYLKLKDTFKTFMQSNRTNRNRIGQEPAITENQIHNYNHGRYTKSDKSIYKIPPSFCQSESKLNDYPA